jgi:hypothetical protein
MIPRPQRTGILGKGDLLSKLRLESASVLICRPVLFRLIADRPKENGVVRDETSHAEIGGGKRIYQHLSGANRPSHLQKPSFQLRYEKALALAQ